MGGDRETMAEQRVKNATGTVVVGQIRVHENAGQVHFHDDTNKLKVAIPAATWMAAWIDLNRRLGKKWQYFDSDHKTMLTVQTTARRGKPAKKRLASVDALLTVERAEAQPNFTAINKFTFH